MAGSIACSEPGIAESLAASSVDGIEAWITTSDNRLHARQWGSPVNDVARPSIVLLHDPLGRIALWRDPPQRLVHSTGYAVIVYDRLGSGQFNAYPDQLNPSFIQQEAYGSFAALMDQLGVDRFIVFGHSAGSGMAVSTVAACPDHCAGLITESAQAFAEEQTRQGIRIAQAQFAEPGQMGRLERYHGSKAQWMLDVWVNTWLSPAFAHWCLDGALLAVHSPVLALHSIEGEYGSTAQPECIVTLAGTPTTLKLVQCCGHAPHREQEVAAFTAVNAFLAAPA